MEKNIKWKIKYFNLRTILILLYLKICGETFATYIFVKCTCARANVRKGILAGRTELGRKGEQIVWRCSSEYFFQGSFTMIFCIIILLWDTFLFLFEIAWTCGYLEKNKKIKKNEDIRLYSLATYLCQFTQHCYAPRRARFQAKEKKKKKKELLKLTQFFETCRKYTFLSAYRLQNAIINILWCSRKHIT